MKPQHSSDEMPLAYQEGHITFYDLKLFVTEHTLIPRMETELLVEHILKRLDGNERVLDLCTGSGAIGLSLKSQEPSLSVVLSDISSEALAVARKNASSLDLDVRFIESDLVKEIGEEFDVVVCNPPYIADSVYETLEPSVKEYEPKLALVGGADGLMFYRRLASEVPSVLASNGKIFFEIGFDQGDALKNLFTFPMWSVGEIHKDYAGHDRFYFNQKLI